MYTKIKKEQKWLEANLSSSILVTTYKSMNDLMRAYIVGLEETLYCYELYFFDILFPIDYLAKSLEIFYFCNGFDLNPNKVFPLLVHY
jgi:ubiquitin-conjugating enzyme E2 O